MAGDFKEWERIEALLEDPGISDEVRQYALEQKWALQDEHLRKQAPAAGAPSLDADPEADALIGALDPNVSVPAQTNATLPAAVGPGAGPGGVDEEWLAKPSKDLGGPPVIFFEPPVSEVKKRLWEQPELARTFRPDFPVTPEEIDQLTDQSDLYKSVADDLWRQQAAETQKAGRTGYRYSKHEWLQRAKGMSMMESLKLKLRASIVPVAEDAAAFVLGMDKAIPGQPIKKLTDGGEETGFDASGKAFKQPMEGVNDQTLEENPWSALAGEAYGSFAGWNPVNKLGAWVAKPISRYGAEATGAAGFLQRQAAGAVAGGASAAAEQAAYELGNASPKVNPEGSPISMDAMGNPTDAGPLTLDPLSGLKNIAVSAAVGTGLGSASHNVSELAGHTAHQVRHGEHFGEEPAKLEARGGKLSVFGPQPEPSSGGFIERAREENFANPRAVAALDAQPAISKGVEDRITAQKAKNKEAAAAFSQTPEGRAKIPAKNLGDEALRQLRGHVGQTGAKGETIATNPEALEDARYVFNSHVVGGVAIKAKPAPGELVLSPEEAQEFLSPARQKELRSLLKDPTGKQRTERVSAGAESKFVPKKGPLAAVLRSRGIEHVVVSPQRYNASELEDALDAIGQHAKRGGRPPPAGYKEMDEAARRDRDLRPMDGKEKGWSEHQTRVSKEITETENLSSRVGAGGKDEQQQVMRSLVRYGQGGEDQLLQDRALREIAGEQGPEAVASVERIGALDSFLKLRGRASPWGGKGDQQRNFFSRATDPAVLRSVPALDKTHEALKGGRLAQAASLTQSGGQQKEPVPDELKGLPVNDPRVQEYLKRTGGRQAQPELTLDPLAGLRRMFGGTP